MVSDILHVTAALLINILCLYLQGCTKLFMINIGQCGASRMIRITFEYNCPDVFKNVLRILMEHFEKSSKLVELSKSLLLL
jgi:hypothetical protein